MCAPEAGPRLAFPDQRMRDTAPFIFIYFPIKKANEKTKYEKRYVGVSGVLSKCCDQPRTTIRHHHYELRVKSTWIDAVLTVLFYSVFVSHCFWLSGSKGVFTEAASLGLIKDLRVEGQNLIL